MIVTGAVADPKVGSGPTNPSFVDLLWHPDEMRLSKKQQSQPTTMTGLAVKLDLIIQIFTTVSFQREC